MKNNLRSEIAVLSKLFGFQKKGKFWTKKFERYEINIVIDSRVRTDKDYPRAQLDIGCQYLAQLYKRHRPLVPESLQILTFDITEFVGRVARSSVKNDWRV